MKLRKVEDASGALLYRDSGNARDYGRFGKAVNALKKATVVYGECVGMALV